MNRPTMPTRRVKLLIVDDEARNLDALEVLLEASECEFVRATSAEEALLAMLRHDFAAMVLDIRMPGMDGLEAMGRILDQHPSIPVLLNTAYSSYQDSFLSWGADAYVIKSSDTGDLRREVEQLLSGKREGVRRRPGGQPHAQS